MKAINYLLAAALGSATLMTGCSKKDNNYMVAADNAVPSLPAARIAVSVQTVRQKPGYMPQWNAGTIAIRQIQFDETHLVGDMMQLQEYTDKTITSINILTPSTTMLGIIPVPMGLYQQASLGLALDAVAVTSSMNLANSLYLNGAFYSVPPPAANGSRGSFEPIPIQIIVNEPVVLSSIWMSNFRLSEPNYSAMFFIDVNAITAGLSASMLNNAEQNNGVIYITSNSNRNLYDIILANIQNHQMMLQLSPSQVNHRVEEYSVAVPLIR